MYTSCDDDGGVWGCPLIRTSDYFESAHRNLSSPETVASVAHPFIHSSVASHRVASRRPVVVVFGGRRLVFVVTARRREETRRRHDARDGRDG